MRLLNVGGGNKRIPIPAHFAGWEHQMLDIDPNSGADVVCSATEIKERLADKGYDAVYCSHNLEHYHRHDLPKVLDGFKYILTDDGFAEIHVPNMRDVFMALASGKDIEDIAYISQAGPIKYVDIVYGLGAMIEHGNEFMAHKNGFTPKSLGETLFKSGFKWVFVGENKPNMEIVAFAFLNHPTERQMQDLKLLHAPNAPTPPIKATLSVSGLQPDADVGAPISEESC